MAPHDTHSAINSSVNKSFIDPRNPFQAAQFFADCYSEEDSRLICYLGDWLVYTGTHYEELSARALRARLYRWLNTRYRNIDKSPVLPSQTLVNNIQDALKSAVHVDAKEMPCWLGDESHASPKNIIAFRNGLLDIEHWLTDPDVPLLPHDSDWLSINVLPFNYTKEAICPHWEQFIAETANGDETWVAALAMMLGYLLTHDTSQQKIFIFQGAPRSGKGTICRVLSALLGPANVTGPSLSKLCGDFSMWPLVGKSVACVPDAHLGRGSDSTRVLEVLKSISGEDAIDVNRKHRDQQTMRISARFLIACNTLLDLPDPSGALSGRLILFPFTHSFLGKEDHHLEARLLKELPGILCWALAGLRAFRNSGRLVQPQSGDQIRADFARASAPIRGFIDDRLEEVPLGVVPTASAYQAWKGWCEQEGHMAGSASTFGGKLVSALPGITKARLGSEGKRAWCYRGIQLSCSGDVLGRAWTPGERQ